MKFHSLASFLWILCACTNVVGSFLQLTSTLKDSKALDYAVVSRIYSEEKDALYVTLRGGGISKYNIENASNPTLVAHYNGISECEGQDRRGDIFVVATLGGLGHSGLVIMNVSSSSPWPPITPLSRLNLSLPGALHVKLYHSVEDDRTYAIVTTGLTHVSTRSSIVAVDVTDPTRPIEVAKTSTMCKCSEGVIVLPNSKAALIGSYCSNTVQMISLRNLPHSLTPMGVRTKTYYENMVSGIYNSSYEYGDIYSDLIFSATYTDPGGLVVFNASTVNQSLGVPTEVSKFISNSTARANRVHVHPSGVAFLALEKSHGGDARGGIAAIDIRAPTQLTLLAAIKTPSNSSRTYCVASATDNSGTGVLYAFGATSKAMYVYTFKPLKATHK